jgi:hypothetical protein
MRRFLNSFLQFLDLLQVAAILAAELRTRPPQIECPESFDPDLLRRLLDNRPNGSVAQSSPITFPLFESGRSRRPFSILAETIQALIPCLTQSGVATVGTRPPFAAQIGDDPPAFPQLDVLYI